MQRLKHLARVPRGIDSQSINPTHAPSRPPTSHPGTAAPEYSRWYLKGTSIAAGRPTFTMDTNQGNCAGGSIHDNHGRGMMKGISRAACLAVLLVPGFTVAADYGCDNVRFGDEVTKAFPNIKEACHGVTTKNNEPYAKFVAEVVSADSEQVVVNFLDAKDKPVSKITFATNPNATIKVDGQSTKLSKVPRGTRSNFYIAHDKWGLYSTPEDVPFTILKREEP